MSANLGTDDHRFVVPARERPRDRTRRRAEGLLAAISLRSRPSEHQSAIVRRPADDRPPDGAVLAFLRAHHGVDVLDLVALGGGFWSASYAYGVGSDELVLRLADTPDGFRADESAQAYGSASMPVPEVLAIGQGLDRWFAISRRHHGRFLEDVSPDEADAVAPAVIGLLRGPLGGAQHQGHSSAVAGVAPRRDHRSAGTPDVGLAVSRRRPPAGGSGVPRGGRSDPIPARRLSERSSARPR
jgi:hypothetical protein